MLQIKNTLGGGKPEGLYAWKKCQNDTDHTFIDYVVSDKETAYPDGGEKGGYWYEKAGEAKVTKGKFATSASTLTIDVGIENIDGFVAYDSNGSTNTNEIWYLPAENIAKVRKGNYNWTNITVTQNETSITITTGNNTLYGYEMVWYAFKM